MDDPVRGMAHLQFRSRGNQTTRNARPTIVINCSRSSLLAGITFCVLVVSVLVFVLISPGLPR